MFFFFFLGFGLLEIEILYGLVGFFGGAVSDLRRIYGRADEMFNSPQSVSLWSH